MICVFFDLEVFIINGSEVDGVNIFFNIDYKDFKVIFGCYEILVYYKCFWDLDVDSYEVMKFDLVLFVVDGKVGEFYCLDFECLQNVIQVWVFEEDFFGWVENMNSGEKIFSQVSGLVFNWGFLVLIIGVEVEIKGVNVVQFKVVEVVMLVLVVLKVGSFESGVSVSGQVSYLDMLKVQWNQVMQEECC